MIVLYYLFKKKKRYQHIKIAERLTIHNFTYLQGPT